MSYIYERHISTSTHSFLTSNILTQLLVVVVYFAKLKGFNYDECTVSKTETCNRIESLSAKNDKRGTSRAYSQKVFWNFLVNQPFEFRIVREVTVGSN